MQDIGRKMNHIYNCMGLIIPGIGFRNDHKYAKSIGLGYYARKTKIEYGDLKSDR